MRGVTAGTVRTNGLAAKVSFHMDVVRAFRRGGLPLMIVSRAASVTYTAQNLVQ